MARSVKVKARGTRIPLRYVVLSASAAARHGFPAWVDASDAAVAFPAKAASPRVRDGLVLRTIAKKKKSGKKKSPTDARRAR